MRDITQNNLISELKRKYDSKQVYMIGYPELADVISIPKHVLENPFNFAPKEEFLNPEEIIELNKLEKQETWTSDDFLKMLQLKLKKGASVEEQELRKLKLSNLLKECFEKNLKLPSNFVRLFQENEIFNRFKLGSSHFTLPRKLTQFPYNPDVFIICFHEDQQCCFRYYLLIDLQGNHCIMLNYNDELFPYENQSTIDDNALEFFICADSFEEYIIKISILLKMQSGQMDYTFDT